MSGKESIVRMKGGRKLQIECVPMLSELKKISGECAKTRSTASDIMKSFNHLDRVVEIVYLAT